MKSKGVAKVQSRGSEAWGSTLEMVKEFGYSQKRMISRSGDIEIADLEPEKRELNVEAYDEAKHLDLVRKMYLERMKMPEQQLDGQLEYIKNNSKAIISWNLYVDNNEVMGNSIVNSLSKNEFY